MRIKPCYKGVKSNCGECYQQEQDILTKDLDSFIKVDLGDGIDLCQYLMELLIISLFND